MLWAMQMQASLQSAGVWAEMNSEWKSAIHVR
jgi:hypothetical protein